MLTLLLLAAATIPFAMAALLTRVWWVDLDKPWLLAVIAIVGLYVLFGALVLNTFSGIGIAGTGGVKPSPFGPVEQELLLHLVIGTIAGLAVLWGVKMILAK